MRLIIYNAEIILSNVKIEHKLYNRKFFIDIQTIFVFSYQQKNQHYGITYYKY